MNPNNAQALQQNQAGQEEEEDIIDYDALYGGLDIDVTPEAKSPELKSSFGDVVKDVAKQFTKETLIGAGGTWGDLAELAGINAKPNDEKNTSDFQAFENIEKGSATLQDIDALEAEEYTPSLTFPTSQNLRDVGESVGAPGEAQTHAGKYAGRAGKQFGAGLAFGQVAPISSALAGSAGQAVEDVGGGELAQAGAEIATLLLSQGRGKTLVGSAKKDVQDKINQLRQLGYTEQDITLAINSASEGKKAFVPASKGAGTKKAFENFAEHSDDIVSDILSSSVPGFHIGPKYVHQLASNAYGEVAKQAAGIKITNPVPFIKSATDVVKQVRNTLGKNPEAEAFLKRLSDAVMDSTKNPSAESFMNFYKELGGMGNWMSRSNKDRLINQVKDGIKDTFRAEGKAGKQLADKFEQVNAGVRKAYQAEDVADLMQKVTTQDGIDYKKFNKLFDKKENMDLFADVVGHKQANNLQLISKTGKEIKDFDKAWQSVSLLPGNPLGNLGAGAYLFYSHNWDALPVIAGGKLAEVGSRKLAELFLTDPKFQNLYTRSLHAIRTESPRIFKTANDEMQKYLEGQGIDIDISLPPTTTKPQE